MYFYPDNILPHHGEVLFFPEFISPVDSDIYFQYLSKDILWKQEPIKLFGKTIMQPRLTALYGDPHKSYSYSGITMYPKEWTVKLTELKACVEKIAGVQFNIALLNFYRNGNDSMGWHRDNEKELGKEPVIASLSFGVTRRFQLREHATKQNLRTLELNNGSLVIMLGETQHYWEHRIPKNARETGSRINITFRVLK